MKAILFIILIMTINFSKGQSYEYNPDGKADPFEPLVVKDLQTSGGDGTETTDIADLVLVGTTVGVDSSALMKLPNGEIIHVRVGDRVGKNRAMITSIGEGKIVLRESLPNSGAQSTKKFKDITFEILTAEDKSDVDTGASQEVVPTLDVQTHLPLILPTQTNELPKEAAPEKESASEKEAEPLEEGEKMIDNSEYLGDQE